MGKEWPADARLSNYPSVFLINVLFVLPGAKSTWVAYGWTPRLGLWLLHLLDKSAGLFAAACTALPPAVE